MTQEVKYRNTRNREILPYARKGAIVAILIYLLSTPVDVYIMKSLNMGNSGWLIVTVTTCSVVALLYGLSFSSYFAQRLHLLVLGGTTAISIQHLVYFQSALSDPEFYYGFSQTLATFAILLACATLSVSLIAIGLMACLPILLALLFEQSFSYVLQANSLYMLVLVSCLTTFYSFVNDRKSRTQYHLRLSLEKEVQHNFQLANRDTLACCYNRRYFETAGEQEIQRALRSHQPLSLAILDIDNFKRVNDTYGHTMGDMVIKAISEACVKEVRPADTVARIGGEEFVILLPETDLENSKNVLERVRTRIEQNKIQIERDKFISVTISIGIAALYRDNDSLKALLERADQGLYLSKAGGKNCIHCTDNSQYRLQS